MKLDYKILWFEDQFEEIPSTLEGVEDLLDSLGFGLDIQREEKVTTDRVTEVSKQLKKYNPFDIIFFDFDLGKSNPNGVEIAKEIRKQIYTDMVFYSGQAPGDIRKLLFDAGVDGVFVAGRPTLVDDVEPIIEDQIRRICDVNSMRGIVMDEVSRLDRRLRKLGSQLLKNGDNSETALKNFKRRVENSASDSVKKANRFTCPIAAFSDISTNLDIVKRGVVDLLSSSGHEELRTALQDSGAIHSLQILRNRLAHVEGELDEDGVMTLVDNIDDKFDFEKFSEIRIQLREAHNLINRFL